MVDGGDYMIIQPKNLDPISNSFHLIIYILQGGGGGLGVRAIPDAVMPFFRLMVVGGWWSDYAAKKIEILFLIVFIW